MKILVRQSDNRSLKPQKAKAENINPRATSVHIVFKAMGLLLKKKE